VAQHTYREDTHRKASKWAFLGDPAVTAVVESVPSTQAQRSTPLSWEIPAQGRVAETSRLMAQSLSGSASDGVRRL
jgi:hypothetical protein